MASSEFALSNAYLHGLLEVWETDTNVANNTSVVHAKVSIWRTNGAYTTYSSSVTKSLSIDGTEVYAQTAELSHTSGTIVIAEGAKTVTHNSDGSRSVGVSFAMRDNVGGNFTGGTSLSMGLVTIPRASQPSINTYPNNSPNFTIGDKIIIHMNRKSGSFTHTVKINFGSTSYQIATGVGDNCTFETSKIADQLYALIPSASSYSNTISVTTYSGGTNVGTLSCNYTARINEASCRPAFQNFTYKDTNTGVTAITGNDQYLVQGKSKLRVTIPRDYKATGMHSASVKGYEAAISGLSASGAFSAGEDVNIDFASSAFVPGTQTLSCLARDSRNLTTKVTKNVQVIAYAEPQIQATAERENNFENATTLAVKGIYSPLTVDGESKNTVLSVKYRYKAQSTTEWSEWAEMESLNVTDAGEYTTKNKILDLDNTKAFDFEVEVTDRLSKVTAILIVSVGIPIFRIGTDGFVYNNEQPLMPSHVGQVIQSTKLDTAEKVQAIYGGKWQAWGQGRVPVGVDPNDPDFNAPNKTGGAKTVTLTVEQMPSHSHGDRMLGGMSGNYQGYVPQSGAGTQLEHATSNAGGGRPHENMPPFRTMYYWERVA